MTHDETYNRQPWMDDDQWFCAQMWADIMHGFHHCSGFKPFGRGIAVSEYASKLSTFDFSYLTHLVFLAHDRCVRVELANSSPSRIKIALHRRHKREGAIYEHHPTLEAAVKDWRKRHPEVTP